MSGADLRAPGHATARSVWLAHLLSLAIGAAAFLLLLGPDTLRNEVPFLATPTGDFAAEQASYVLISRDVWRFPFLALPFINMPEGANAVFVGGVPLLGLLSRLWGAVSGTVPNLMGFWFFLCFALQTHALFFLMRQITDRRPLVLALCSVVGVMTYAFLTRFGHVSLFGHFLVIYGMGLLLATLRPDRRPATTLLLLAGLSIAALLVFAYLAVSLALLFGAALAMLWVSGRLRWWEVMSSGTAYAGSLLLVLWTSGYFWAAARAEPADLVSYALLGFNPGGLVIPPGSPIFPGQPLLRYWWEGDFYLGLGTLLLLLVLVVLRPGVLWRGLTRAWPIVAILLLLTLYALSNRWMFGSTVLLEYTLPRWALPVVGLARSGGRLVWPMGYFLIALAFALAVTRLGRGGVAFAAVAVLLMGVEAVYPARFLRGIAFDPVEFPLDYPGLQTVMDRHRTLQLYPSFWCDHGADGSMKRVAHWQLQITSARANQSSNSGITVRKQKDCEREAAAMPGEILRPGELDVFVNAFAFETAFRGREADADRHCRKFVLRPSVGYMCSRDWEPGTALPIRALMPLDAPSSTFVTTRVVDFTSTGNWEEHARNGWWRDSDGAFTWTNGPLTTLVLDIPPAEGRRWTLRFEVLPFLPTAIPRRDVTVSSGDLTLADWHFSTSDWTTLDITLPPALEGGPLRLHLQQGDTRSPRDLGLGPDPRNVGLAFRRVTLIPTPD